MILNLTNIGSLTEAISENEAIFKEVEGGIQYGTNPVNHWIARHSVTPKPEDMDSGILVFKIAEQESEIENSIQIAISAEIRLYRNGELTPKIDVTLDFAINPSYIAKQIYDYVKIIEDDVERDPLLCFIIQFTKACESLLRYRASSDAESLADDTQNTRTRTADIQKLSRLKRKFRSETPKHLQCEQSYITWLENRLINVEY